ncbi:SIMPL domain-containing protein [Bacillus taeanensis]|nr:SIMPL domain-containing protein [Bacillus taeanensis]
MKINHFMRTNQANVGYQYPFNYNQRSYYPRNRKENHTIKVTGKSILSAKPDQAVLSLGIVTEDMEVQTAQKQNALISNQVINALHNMGIEEDEIETESYTIEQMYDYPNGEKVFRGYKVKHMLKVTVKDLSRVGEIIDAAAQNGANVINQVEFEVSDRNYYYQEALKQASLNARKKAETIANSLGLTINRIPLWVVEESVQFETPRYPTPVLYAAAPAEAATPIQEGDIKITASVQAMFEYEGFQSFE